jgi:16S rRNA (uracil1498-N3)-methyltransferase
MHRTYIPELSSAQELQISGDEAHHLTRVLRVAVGDQVEVFDGRGLSRVGAIRYIARDRIRWEPTAPFAEQAQPPATITVASAFPKGERLDWMVEKLVEIGVQALQPIRSERSVVDPRHAKLARLERRVIESCKQCGRNRLMRIEPVVDFPNLLLQTTSGARLLADLDAPTLDHSTAISAAASQLTLAIGPEGGWTDAERSLAKAAGWSPIGLGILKMRIETAAIVGAAILHSIINRSI